MGPSESTTRVAFEAAQERIKGVAAEAVNEAAGNMLAHMRSARTYRERSKLSLAQAHLLQTQDAFLTAFGAGLHKKVEEETGPHARDRSLPDETDWQAVSLVEEDQIEERLSFERIGQFISHECEAELRELSAYTSSMLRHGWADPDRNPLRGNVIGSAVYEAVEKISDDRETQKILATELGQPMARALPACYRAIIDDLKTRGVRPAELAVRPAELPARSAGISSAFDQARHIVERSLRGRIADDAADTLRSWESSILGRIGRSDPIPEGYDPESAGALLERLIRGVMPSSAPSGPPSARSLASIQADAELMNLLRRLNEGDTVPDDLHRPSFDSGSGFAPSQRFDSAAPSLDTARSHWPQAAPWAAQPASSGFSELMAANLIRAHRQELLQASQGKLDHMVIEVVSSLFDQILSDSRVPPQMARQIARLQLPVLRFALKDPTFFSTRRHPVRRFINRVSSLATALDDFESGPGRELLVRVDRLVKDIVEGDFDQVDVYSEKLLALEKFTAEQTHAEIKASPAAATLSAKELEWRLHYHFSLLLHSALQPLALTPYLHEFLSQVWSQVILAASERDGAESSYARDCRRVGFDIVVSVQPKRSLEQRKHFLATLPGLMSRLNEGLTLIDWPPRERAEFLGKLISEHARSLRGGTTTELDYNMMLRHVEAAFRTPIPQGAEEATKPIAEPARPPAFEQRFSPEEAKSVGLIGEDSVDWSSGVDPAGETPPPGATTGAAAADATADAAQVTASDVPISVLDDSEEPTQGPQLRHHLQLGFSYQLYLKDHWEKVRLNYLGPGRTLFLFRYGSKDRRSITMTARMLERLCETRRLRTFEHASLVDRATERARQQLAALASPDRPAAH